MTTGNLNPQPIRIGPTHQLFLDDYLIESREKLSLVVNPVKKHPANPVIHPELDWEPRGYIAYGSVIWDDEQGLYKAWCQDVGGRNVGGANEDTKRTGLFYFTSEDGINWQRPELDVVTFGDVHTNIVALVMDSQHPAAWPYCQEFFGVSKDPSEADPDRRYKLGYLYLDRPYEGDDGDPDHPGEQRGLGVAFSPDGIHWTPRDTWVTHATIDGSTCWMWDPRLSKWVIYGRDRHIAPDVAEKWGDHPEFQHHWGRAVKRAESEDFLTWEPDWGERILHIDTEDGPGHEIYGMNVFPYEGIYIGLVQMFYCYADNVSLDIQLAVSRDGIHFDRLSDRSPFIPLGGVGAWDRMNHSAANNPPIRVGDELRFYYGGRNYRHSAPYKFADDGQDATEHYVAGVGIGTVPVDRFAGLVASFDTGRLVTRPLQLDSGVLHVNANVKFGALQVAVLDVEGNALPDSEARVTGVDAVDIPLDLPALAGSVAAPVRLAITVANGHLYSLWVE